MTRWLLRLKACGPTVVDKAGRRGPVSFPGLFLDFPIKLPMLSASWTVLTDEKKAFYCHFIREKLSVLRVRKQAFQKRSPKYQQIQRKHGVRRRSGPRPALPLASRAEDSLTSLRPSVFICKARTRTLSGIKTPTSRRARESAFYIVTNKVRNYSFP